MLRAVEAQGRGGDDVDLDLRQFEAALPRSTSAALAKRSTGEHDSSRWVLAAWPPPGSPRRAGTPCGPELALNDHQAADVFGEMSTLAIVVEEVPKNFYAQSNYRWPLHDPRHRRTLHGLRTPPVAISLAVGRRPWRPAPHSQARLLCNFRRFLPILANLFNIKMQFAKLQVDVRRYELFRNLRN